MSNTAALTKQQTLKVAKLANLQIADSKLESLSEELNGVLDYVGTISQLKTTNTPETHQVTNLTNVFREDEIDQSRILTQDQALSGAKRTHSNYFVVAATIDKEQNDL